MELTIKHLAPYLPYGLKLKEGELSSISHRWGTLKYVDSGNDDYNTSFERVTPILKPLSKLTDEELIPIGLFIRDIEKHKATYKDNIFAIEDSKAWIKTGMKPVLSLKQVQGIMEHLYSVHADVFNLIDNNLAVEM